MDLLIARIVCACIFMVVQIVNVLVVVLKLWLAIYIPYEILQLYLH